MAEHSQVSESLSPPEKGRHASLQEVGSQTSEAPSRSASTGDLQHLEHHHRLRQDKPRVRFTPGGESLDTRNQRASFQVRNPSSSPPPKPLPGARVAPHRQLQGNTDSYFPQSFLDTDISTDVTESPHISPDEHPEQSERRDGRSVRNTYSQASAQERAKRLASMVSHSAPGSRTGSLPVSPNSSPPMYGQRWNGISLDDIPLVDLKEDRHRHYGDDSTDDDEDGPSNGASHTHSSEAHHLFRAMTKKPFHDLQRVHASPGLQSGQVTPTEEQDQDYVPRPKHYRGGILASLLKLYDQQGLGSAVGGSMPSGPGVNPDQYRQHSSGGHSTDSPTPQGSGNSSGKSTPKQKQPKWYDKSPNQSTSSLAGLISSSNMMASPGGLNRPLNWKGQRPGPKSPKDRKGSGISAAMHKMKKPRLEDEIHITIHIAETLSRQKYLIKLCRALMTYGAPTHRLEGNISLLSTSAIHVGSNADLS
jgi:hypothetical protein